MTLTPGSRLGVYEILTPLGAGGMGEVYRARDSKLARDVAIKVLPAEVSADRNRLVRFEQEARSASALNHPNIVTIYEIGSVDSVSYIAMELVQGKTLRELLTEGPLPSKRLLTLSAQIADGLARAHEAGIVHRDLKPDNVMITREGLVKILDFGVAKLAGRSGPEWSQLPTIADPTEPGVILGTVGYMSPEQAMGRPVDFRSDQFSLGSILYEMATGKRAFSRGSAPETLSAIIREEPEPLPRLAPQLPTALRWAIERCLAKEPEERYGSTRDLSRDLSRLRDHISETSLEASPARASRRRGWLAAAWAASLVLVAALALLVGPPSRKEPSVSPVRFSVAIPGDYVGSRVTVSPDGSCLAIETFAQGQRRIFLRRLDSDETVELQGTLGASGHFWSPDSRYLAFWADGKLKKVPISGGPSVELCDVVVLSPGTWSRDGTILFPQRANPYGLFRVSEAGGEAVRVTACKPEEEHRGPWFLPDGRRFLYHMTSHPGAYTKGELRLGSLDSKESRIVTHLDSRAEYSPTGHLVYAREGALFAQRFDERNARLMGEPVLVADDVQYFLNTAVSAFSVSQTGVLAYSAGLSPVKLTWFGRYGKEIGQLGQFSMNHRGFRISPDGARVAMGISDKRTGTADIWVFDLGRGVSTRLHSDTANEFMPVWTPDGTRLLYGSDRRGAPDTYEIPMGQAPGGEKVILEQEGFQQPEDISRDGRFLVYSSAERYPNWDLWLLPLQGEHRALPWAPTRFAETNPRFSPDGRWIAYQSDESGAPEIYVALTQGGGSKKRISPAGGRDPRWRADGKELYYVGPGDFVMAVAVTPGARLEAGTPAPLFRVEGIRNYDVTADGSRFLVITASDPDRDSQVRVIVNWPAVLRPEK